MREAPGAEAFGISKRWQLWRRFEFLTSFFEWVTWITVFNGGGGMSFRIRDLTEVFESEIVPL